ncbi:glycosyltransferase family 2 protein [Candidatus Pelagibacter sp.]|nr:glycosyltransferase family 2 protein [Candidatus Pelagibacter sp.]
MFSVVIPALNEEKYLLEDKFIDLLIKKLTEHNFSKFEIILVDDGSTDSTPEIFKKLKLKYDCVKIYTHAVNKGYGFSLKSGINFASNDVIVISDIDGTYSAQSMVEIIKKYFESMESSSNGIDMVIGSRKGKNLNQNIFKGCLRFFLKTLVQWSSGTKIDDINSGLRIFSKKKITALFPKLSNYFSFTTTSTLAYLSLNLSIVYHPIQYLKRKGRESHVRLLRDSLRTLQYVLEATIYYNPLKFFLFLSFLFLFLSIIVTIIFVFSKILIFKTLFLILIFFSLLSLLVGFLSVLISKTIKHKGN